MKGGYGTNRDTGWIQAVHAQPPHELVVVIQDNCVLVFRLSLLCSDIVVIGKTVLFRAGLLAHLAADANCRIVKDALTHARSMENPSFPQKGMQE
jgi:hypothetical protein